MYALHLVVGRVTSLLQYKIHYNLCQSYTDTKWQLNMREGATETEQDSTYTHTVQMLQLN